MIFNFVGGRPSTKGIPEFTYSGVSNFVAESDNDWQLWLLTSGTLNFSKLKSAAKGIEVCLVGGGLSGSNGNDNGGGAGGYGGRVINELVNPSAEVDYNVTIGGGNGSTMAFGFTAVAGGGSPGGGGGTIRGPEVNGGAGYDGQYAFDDPAYQKFGPGGGGGAGAWGGTTGIGGTGGSYGGGNGGSNSVNVSTAGLANTGGGGGGGQWGGSGSVGGSGVVIIRNRRS